MIVIRLSRGGSKKRPYSHVVVAEKTKPRDGRFIERIGFLNPLASGDAPVSRLDNERFDYWVKKGAKPSFAVLRLARKSVRVATATTATTATAATAATTATTDTTATTATTATACRYCRSSTFLCLSLQ